jgi:hypothetical protein
MRALAVNGLGEVAIPAEKLQFAREPEFFDTPIHIAEVTPSRPPSPRGAIVVDVIDGEESLNGLSTARALPAVMGYDLSAQPPIRFKSLRPVLGVLAGPGMSSIVSATCLQASPAMDFTVLGPSPSAPKTEPLLFPNPSLLGMPRPYVGASFLGVLEHG